MSATQIDRILKIKKIIPIEPYDITVSEIKERLENHHNIYVDQRTIQRDMGLISYIFFDEIDYWESDSGSFHWFKTKNKKSIPKKECLTDNKTEKSKSDFRGICNDLAYFLDPELVFTAARNNENNFFGLNSLFSGFTILPHNINSKYDRKLITFIYDYKSAEKLIKRSIETITNQSQYIIFIFFYIDLEKHQWDEITRKIKNYEDILKNKDLQVIERFRGNQDNGTEIFDEYLDSYDNYQKILWTRLLDELGLNHISYNEYLESDLDPVQLLEEQGDYETFDKHAQIIYEKINHEWYSFLLLMAKKHIPGTIIIGDSICFNCNESSNKKTIYSIKHDDIFVSMEIQDLLLNIL